MDGSTSNVNLTTANVDPNSLTSNVDIISSSTSNVDMGGATIEEINNQAPNVDLNKSSSTLECAICLEICLYPTELPCKHVFCFLCIKGISSQNLQCALCRAFFPHTLLQNPKLLKPAEIANIDNSYQWFYEGKSGWWQYDERASTEMESAYQNGSTTCQLLLAGHLYVVDFNLMMQYRRNDGGGTGPAVPIGRQRRIKRDQAIPNKLGVAGLRMSLATGSSQLPAQAPCLQLPPQAPFLQLPVLPPYLQLPAPSVGPIRATPNRRSRRRQAAAAVQTPTTAAANRRRRRRGRRRNTAP